MSSRGKGVRVIYRKKIWQFSRNQMLAFTMAAWWVNCCSTPSGCRMKIIPRIKHYCAHRKITSSCGVEVSIWDFDTSYQNLPVTPVRIRAGAHLFFLIFFFFPLAIHLLFENLVMSYFVFTTVLQNSSDFSLSS